MDDITILEQDLELTVQALEQLAACPHPLCAQAYPLWHEAYRPDPMQPRKYFSACAHRVYDPGSERQRRWIDEGTEWADFAGFGLLRIRREFQDAHAPDWASGPWDTLDTRFSYWVQGLGLRFHVHWPLIAHHHRCPCHGEN